MRGRAAGPEVHGASFEMIVAMLGRWPLALIAGALAASTVIVPSLTRGSVLGAPSTFVANTSTGEMSPSSTRSRTLARIPPNAFTDNGLAYASDGSAGYLMLIARHTRRFSLRLMRLDVRRRPQGFIADGAEPALI